VLFTNALSVLESQGCMLHPRSLVRVLRLHETRCVTIEDPHLTRHVRAGLLGPEDLAGRCVHRAKVVRCLVVQQWVVKPRRACHLAIPVKQAVALAVDARRLSAKSKKSTVRPFDRPNPTQSRTPSCPDPPDWGTRQDCAGIGVEYPPVARDDDSLSAVDLGRGTH
jgi:hypothetical protein